MGRWDRKVEDLLYDGESVHETVEFAEAAVVVTSHRVLAFTPDMEGANFTQVERPNVAGVDTGARAETGLLERGVRVGVVGVVLVGTGWLVDFGGVVGDVDLTGGGAAGRLGIGDILGPLQQMMAVLRNLDQYMQLFGALALLLGVGLVGVYWLRRSPTLVIEVAGDEDIHVPRPVEATDVARQLERAIAPERPEKGVDRGADPLGEA